MLLLAKEDEHKLSFTRNKADSANNTISEDQNPYKYYMSKPGHGFIGGGTRGTDYAPSTHASNSRG